MKDDPRRDCLPPDTRLIDDMSKTRRAELIVDVAKNTYVFSEHKQYEVSFLIMILTKAIVEKKVNELVHILAAWGQVAKLIDVDIQKFVDEASVEAARELVDEVKKKFRKQTPNESFSAEDFERAMKERSE